jgi:hypothetical protein
MSRETSHRLENVRGRLRAAAQNVVGAKVEIK